MLASELGTLIVVGPPSSLTSKPRVKYMTTVVMVAATKSNINAPRQIIIFLESLNPSGFLASVPTA
jgi:hypothetical protein